MLNLTSSQKQADNFILTANQNAMTANKIKNEISLAERITKAFSLTTEQSNYMANLLAKDYNKDENKFNPTERAILYAASIAQKRDGIIDGTYTITSVTGDHRTIELNTNIDINDKVFFGKRTVALLVGSNNSRDYKNFGFFSATRGISVFKKALAQNSSLQKIADFASSLLIDGENGKAAKIGFTLRISKRCIACGRKLTVPSSLDVSMGAKCYNDIHA